MTASTAEINHLKQAAVTHEAEYRNAILDKDQARDSEKKRHEVTRQETQLAYSLLTEAYKLYHSTGEDAAKY